MTLSTLKLILNGIPNEDFGDYTLVRDSDSSVILGVRIDEKLKVVYI